MHQMIRKENTTKTYINTVLQKCPTKMGGTYIDQSIVNQYLHPNLWYQEKKEKTNKHKTTKY